MLSVSFVKPFEVFASDLGSIIPICTTNKILSYKSSGNNAIGINYHDVEPETVSISVDDSDIALAIEYANNYNIFEDIASPQPTLSAIDWDKLRVWGCGIIIWNDGLVLLNGWVKLDTIKYDKAAHVFQFRVFDIVATNAIKTSTFSLSYSTDIDIPVLDLLPAALKADVHKFGNTIDVDTGNVSFDVSFTMGQVVNGDILPLAIEIVPNNIFKAHDTPPYARYIDTPANWGDPVSDHDQHWFLGIRTVVHSHRITDDPVYETVMFAIRLDINKTKAVMCRWAINADNPISNTTIIPTQYINGLTQDGLTIALNRYVSDYDGVIALYMGSASQTQFSEYVSPIWGWKIRAYINIPNYFTDVMPMDYGNPIFITGEGEIASFPTVRFVDNTPKPASDIVSALLQLNNWTLTGGSLSNYIQVVNKLKIQGSDDLATEITGHIITDSISGFIVDQNPSFKIGMFSGSANAMNVLKAHYQLLFARFRYKADIVIDGFASFAVGEKIAYRGYEYYVFGINYDSNTTLITALGERSWQ